ncbi:DUF1206 domain-containing protein [Mycobacterium sp. 1274761.0]|uniref:DUF1206 domain-containing protein n=1 Tax=Mycobacterium sp. 1274761.0 TaxID=1834077 RepID=UPI0007FF429E|nr:DUF1206 domain-containing protein [Mycobacterium sp. 1274761.0]OBK78460.1 hypothetical protein A5651_02615 [Mycobacterium sp. 1274761.0]
MGFKSAVNRATDNRAAQRVARAGYLISGTLHLLVAVIIVRIAFGAEAEAEADQTGALATVARTPGGAVMLYVVAAGLIALAMWRLSESVLGLHPAEHSDAHKRESPVLHRLKAFGLAMVYGFVASTALQFALGAHARGSRQTAGLSARLMQTLGGKAVLVAVGVVVLAIGAYYAHKGASRRFLDDLNVDAGRLLTALGICGHVAEGLVLSAVGISVIVATFLGEPAKATGLDGAVKAFRSTQFGGALLIAAAVGFAAYGLYSFALTRYSRM